MCRLYLDLSQGKKKAVVIYQNVYFYTSSKVLVVESEISLFSNRKLEISSNEVNKKLYEPNKKVWNN